MNASSRDGFRVCFAACLILMANSARLWGAAEVRGDVGEIFFITAFGFVWLALAVSGFAWLGLSLADDVVERRNTAAFISMCGAMLAVAAIYTGGSLGEGPAYLNNFFSAGVGTAGLFAVWGLFELAGKASDSITVDRDAASGLRLGGFLLAVGLVIGRAVAGDWPSVPETVHDLVRDAWPVAILWVIAIVIERFTRPTRRHPFPPWPSRGLLPALFYLALAAAWIGHLGRWEGMPP